MKHFITRSTTPRTIRMGHGGKGLVVHACGVCRYLEAGGDHGLAPSAAQALGLEGGRDLLTPQPPYRASTWDRW